VVVKIYRLKRGGFGLGVTCIVEDLHTKWRIRNVNYMLKCTFLLNYGSMQLVISYHNQKLGNPSWVMFTQTKGSMWHSVQNKFQLGNVLLSVEPISILSFSTWCTQKHNF
jgi:hypothetical protein